MVGSLLESFFFRQLGRSKIYITLFNVNMNKPQAVEQLAFADVILLNKVDLVNEQEKAAVVKRIKARSRLLLFRSCTDSRWPTSCFGLAPWRVVALRCEFCKGCVQERVSQHHGPSSIWVCTELLPAPRQTLTLPQLEFKREHRPNPSAAANTEAELRGLRSTGDQRIGGDDRGGQREGGRDAPGGRARLQPGPRAGHGARLPGGMQAHAASRWPVFPCAWTSTAPLPLLSVLMVAVGRCSHSSTDEWLAFAAVQSVHG